MTGLEGKHVVVTRALHQSAELIRQLDFYKAIPIVYPCVEIVPPKDLETLDRNVFSLFDGSFDWLVLTSQNSVQSIALRKKILGIGQSLPPHLRVAAVGPKTASAAQELLGARALTLPKVYNSKALGLMLSDCAGQKILLPQADLAQPELAEKLSQLGAQVVPVVAYDTKKGIGGVDLPEYARRWLIDAIIFASPSAVRFFQQRFLDEGGETHMLKSVCIACIGNVTRDAAIEAGFDVAVTPKNHAIESLIHALINYFVAMSKHVQDR